MKTQAGVGVSNHRNPVQAGKEAASKAIEAMGGGKPDFCFVFASVGYKQDAIVKSVREATQFAPLSGCSAEGIIAQNVADESNFGVTVMTIKSDELKFHPVKAVGLKEDSYQVGEEIASQLRSVAERENVMGLFVFSDTTINFDKFVQGVEKTMGLNKFLPMLGGISADNWKFTKTYQYCNDNVFVDGTACVLMTGNADTYWTVNHGCVAIGAERKVTRCEGNLIYEIDGKPVLDVLKEYLEDQQIDKWEQAVISMCLGLKAPEAIKGEYSDYLIRFIPSRDEAAGCIQIMTEVEPGESIWMTRRDHELVHKGLEKMAKRIKDQLAGKQPKMVFQFDCCGRGKVLFPEEKKLEALRKLQEPIGTDVPWVGFFTYGEICPVGNQNSYHNYTAVIYSIY